MLSYTFLKANCSYMHICSNETTCTCTLMHAVLVRAVCVGRVPMPYMHGAEDLGDLL